MTERLQPSLIVERARQVAREIAHARSRRAFLAALEHFEQALALAPDYPPGCLGADDGQALGGLADVVIAHVEHRLAHHVGRAAVQRVLAARVDQIRRDVENVRALVSDAPAAPR